MISYLQRLLDRAAPAPPASGLVPAGLSQSPVSLADQRLNDPDFADRAAPAAPPGEGSELFGEAPQPPRAAPRRGPQRHAAEITLPEPSAPEAAAPSAPGKAPAAAAAATETPPTVESPQHPSPVGFVDAADLVLPEPEPAPESKVPEHTPAAPPTVTPAVPTAQTTRTEPPAPVTPRPVRDSVADRSKQISEAAPTPPRPRAEPIPAATAPDLTLPAGPADSPTAPESRPAVELMPPPVVVPELPAPPVTVLRQPEPPPAPAPAPQAQQPQEAAQAPAPSQKRHTRPMNAAEASIIGPLTPRRRALTLFGLRRR